MQSDDKDDDHQQAQPTQAPDSLIKNHKIEKPLEIMVATTTFPTPGGLLYRFKEKSRQSELKNRPILRAALLNHC
jgi:hypothetical protein